MRYLTGVLFCAILVTFAILSKTAVYYHHNSLARPLTAAKVMLQPSTALSEFTPSAQTYPTLIFLVFACAALAIAARFSAWLQTVAQVTSVSPIWHCTALSIRPPPRRQ
jgi:hypothetical protein